MRTLNPLALRMAGRRWLPVWARLSHRGRRSGKEYQIPVAVLVTPDSFVIALPWGTQTNWVQNVLAAGGCTIFWKGADHHATQPRLVDTKVALAAANRFERVIIARVNFPGFLELQR
jgi:deazaflavin-dependent oxidoreductase (nitroreductase family)